MSKRVEAQYDVLVVGGGAAGVAAAVGAAKTGAKVCLVEKYGFLGGAATTAQVSSYCGLFQQGQSPVKAVAGVADDILLDLKSLGLEADAYRSETTGNWIVMLDTEVLKLALDRITLRHGIDVLLHTRCASVSRTGGQIEAVTLAGMDGRTHVVAESFVDASGDANLAMLAGVPFQVGDEEGRLQALTMPIRIGGVDPNLKLDRRLLQQLIAEYNDDGRFPIARTDGGIIIRLPVSRDFWWMVVDLPLANLSSRSFTRAEMTGREMAYDYVNLMRRMPGFEKAYVVATGPQVGVRETRHPESRYRMTGEDIMSGRLFDEGIARAAWPIELHAEAGKPVYKSVGGKGYAHVPYDAIRAANLDNLWYAGRVIGADSEAYGSIRVMGTAFATGEAAGVAAADYVERNHMVDVASVKARLLQQGALL